MITGSNQTFLSFAQLPSSNVKKSDSNKNKYINAGLAVGATAIGTGIGYIPYKADRDKLSLAIKQAESEADAKSPEINKVMEKLKEKFIDLVVREKEGKPTSFPNCIMLVGENPIINDTVITVAGKRSKHDLVRDKRGDVVFAPEKCSFVRIKHTDSLVEKFKEAKARHEETGNRTLIHVDGFDQLLDPNRTPANKMDSLKSVMSDTSEKYHSTIIFSTTDPSKLNHEAMQFHRTERIDVNVAKSDFEAMTEATQKAKWLREKLAELPKTKIMIGAGIGLVAGIIVIGIKHLISKKRENNT